MIIQSNVGAPSVPEHDPAPTHERPNADLWKKAIEAFRVAQEADEKTLAVATTKPATFTEYVGRVTRCGGGLVYSGVSDAGKIFRYDAPKRIGGKKVGCDNIADPRFGICESCQAEERGDHERLLAMGKPAGDEPSKGKGKSW